MIHLRSCDVDTPLVARLFIFFIFCLNSQVATAKEIAWEKFRFKVDVAESWRDVKDFYGIPVTLLGPSVPAKPRAVVQIIPTDLPPGKMNLVESVAFGIKYGEGRKKWITEQQGELLELLPGKFENGRMTAGVSYRINQKSYLERTYYVNCKKNLYHLKIVLNFENREQLPESENIVRSFACAD